jgi:hypothetical protein
MYERGCRNLLVERIFEIRHTESAPDMRDFYVDG